MVLVKMVLQKKKSGLPIKEDIQVKVSINVITVKRLMMKQKLIFMKEYHTTRKVYVCLVLQQKQQGFLSEGTSDY